jgi:hypothetical protein
VLAAGSVLVLVAFNEEGALGDGAGVIQRCWLTIAFAWLAAVSVHVVHGDNHLRLPGPIGTANT